MRVLNLTVAGLTLAVIGVVTLWEAEERTSPGPLHPCHAVLDELRGLRGCDACHGDASRGALARACESCHARIAEQRSSGQGLHGTAEQAARCDRCHVEHHGADSALLDAHVFALAGVADKSAYDHAHVVGWNLVGAHERLACKDCHPHCDDDPLRKGTLRYLGLSLACASCHEDPHEGRLGNDCADCHGQTIAWDRVGEFRHRRFAVDGAHAELACVKCHEKDGAFAVDRLRDTDPEPRACTACHGDPHGDPQGDPASVTGDVVALAGATDCARCHDTRAFRDAVFGVAEHRSLGVELAGAHARAKCAACHTPSRAAAVHVPAVTAMTRCTDCHALAHAAGGNALPLAGANDCARCHDDEDFDRARFGPGEHRAIGVELAGRHAEAKCDACHTPARADRLIANGPIEQPAARCTDCHASPHRTPLLDAVASLQARTGDAACALCHDADAPRFVRPAARLTDDVHALAGMRLDKPHAGLRCEQCHLPKESFAARYPGRAPDACAACHADPHRAQFDVDGRAADCLRCHAREEFVPALIDVERHAQSAFPLEGAHRATPCNACHLQDKDAPRRFAGTPRACVACHADPHRGQFDLASLPHAIDGRADCARCHGESSFRELRADFDHGAWTGFALRGAHARTDCASCHGRTATPDRQGRTLGPAPQRCADCHRDVHLGQLARGTPPVTDCARCHDETVPFTTLRFDHARDTRFVLDASHSKLACAACHKEHTLADGTRAVRWRPLGMDCTDCHGGREVRR